MSGTLWESEVALEAAEQAVRERPVEDRRGYYREETELGEGELIRVAPALRRQLVNREVEGVTLQFGHACIKSSDTPRDSRD